jgi:hypothetical protein
VAFSEVSSAAEYAHTAIVWVSSLVTSVVTQQPRSMADGHDPSWVSIGHADAFDVREKMHSWPFSTTL